MSLTVYRKQLLLGGGATALDGIDGAILLNLDECAVYESGVAYTYILNATSGAADDGLNTIAPDTNPGTKRWILNKSYMLMTDDEAVAMSNKLTTPAGGISSGGYTPTISATVNVASSTMHSIGWIRVGSNVFVFGAITITPTASIYTEFMLDLPISSNLGNPWKLGGAGAISFPAPVTAVVGIVGYGAPYNTALFSYTSPSTDSQVLSFSFGYQVI